MYQEGCLSVPGIFADVTRSDVISVQALDRHGATAFTIEADSLLAVCIQHDDHLDGKLFVDYLSPLKREMVKAGQGAQARRPDRCASSSPARRIRRALPARGREQGRGGGRLHPAGTVPLVAAG